MSNYLSSQKTMTIKQVSESLGVSRGLIEKRINELYPNRMRRGVVTYLTEEEVTAVSIRIKENSSIITTSDDHRRLVKTDLEKELLIQQAMMFQAEKIQRMQSEIEVMKPKALFYDQAMISDDSIDMSEAVKILNLGIGRNKLFELLRKDGILRNNNQPYQEYIDRGYFRLIEQVYTTPYGKPMINTKTLISQKGLNYIMKRYKRS